MKFIVCLVVAMLFCSLLSGCDTAPRQYREYQYDIYSPSGELFTVATVRSVATPKVIGETITNNTGEVPTGRVVIQTVDQWGNALGGNVTVPSGWLVVEHGKTIGE